MQITAIEARKILHQRMATHEKRHKRTHGEAYYSNSQRLRALELPDGCATCRYGWFEKIGKDGKPCVSLRCRKGYSPIKVAEATPFGAEKLNCQGYKSKESR